MHTYVDAYCACFNTFMPRSGIHMYFSLLRSERIYLCSVQTPVNCHASLSISMLKDYSYHISSMYITRLHLQVLEFDTPETLLSMEDSAFSKMVQSTGTANAQYLRVLIHVFFFLLVIYLFKRIFMSNILSCFVTLI